MNEQIHCLRTQIMLLGMLFISLLGIAYEWSFFGIYIPVFLFAIIMSSIYDNLPSFLSKLD